MNFDEVQFHSKMAFEKWKDLWTKNSILNKGRISTKHQDFLGCFSNKVAVLFSYGPAFQRNVEEFKRSDLFGNKDVVIGCVDKALRPLIESGVRPHACLIADGSIDFSWVKGISDNDTQNVTLISNVYATPEWSEHWARVSGKSNIVWYLNKDNLNSHHHFGKLCDYYEVIPAASNVGNSLVVFFTQIFGCKEVYLYGYNYSWNRGKYYGATDSPKRYSLGMLRPIDKNNDIVWSSSNMDFSCRWLNDYFEYCEQHYGCKFYDGTGEGILTTRRKVA